MRILVKVWAKPVLIVLLGACVGLVFVTLVILHKGAVITQKANSAGTANFGDQAISKEDHKFLDDLFQQQDRDDGRPMTFPAEPGQNLAKAESDSKPAPRAELIVNSSEVKRAQLVVNRPTVERAELVRPRHQ